VTYLAINARRRNFAACAKTHASSKFVLAKQLVCTAIVALLVAREEVLARIR